MFFRNLVCVKHNGQQVHVYQFIATVFRFIVYSNPKSIITKMKKLILLAFLVSLSSCKSVSSKLSNLHKSKTEIREEKKKADVIILATGGTIAGKGESATKAGYKAGEVPIDELLEAVPE